MSQELIPANVIESELEHAEKKIERAMRGAFVDVGIELKHIRDSRLYRNGHSTFEIYCNQRWDMDPTRAYRLISAAECVTSMLPIGNILPTNESQVRPLLRLEDPGHRIDVWKRILASGYKIITAKVVEQEVERKLAELKKAWITLDEWKVLGQDEKSNALARRDGKSLFNETNDNIEWATWTWNPITGCNHGCAYCYAHDIANRFYPQKFIPSFHPDRLAAPFNNRIPDPGELRDRIVFVCSMADLFGEWVPQEWIDVVIEIVKKTPQWIYIFLTKNPKRLADIAWPKNAWVGTTIDVNARVKAAQKAFESVKATVRFASLEPLLEPVKFSDLSMFDWMIIGAQSQGSNCPEFQPEWIWVHELEKQARDQKVAVYMKPNLTIRAREYPSKGKKP